MAALYFTVDEALNILSANNMLPDAVRDVKPDGDGLLVTVAGGIEISVRQESFIAGVLRLSYSSKSWAFKLADSLGKVDAIVDDAIRPHPFIRRQGASLVIDLNSALQARVKGMQIREFTIRDGSVTIGF